MSSNPSAILRKLKLGDVASAMRLSAEAGWNQSEEDWQLLLKLAPEGCLAIEVAGELASTATLFRYGTRLAWVGMVLTKKEFRGRGFARRLLTELLALADRLGVESVKLDATDEGRPIYEKLGFRPEQSVERWESSVPKASQDDSEVSSLFSPDLFKIDLQAFGADRSELLHGLSTRTPPLSLHHSYLFIREGRLRDYIGPFVADSAEAARSLVGRAVHVPHERGWYWDLFVENRNAVALATEFGFTPRRRLLRMLRGKDLRGDEHRIYALGGFELG